MTLLDPQAGVHPTLARHDLTGSAGPIPSFSSRGGRRAGEAALDEAAAELEQAAPPASSRFDEESYLRGAREAAEMLELMGEGDGDPSYTRQAFGVDVLLWVAIAKLSRLTAARVVLRALARLGGELGATFASAAAVLVGLPAAWSHDVAGMVVGRHFFGPKYKGDLPDDYLEPRGAPARAVSQVVFTAYLPAESDERAGVAALAHHVAADLADAGLGREELLAFVELVYEEIAVDNLEDLDGRLGREEPTTPSAEAAAPAKAAASAPVLTVGLLSLLAITDELTYWNHTNGWDDVSPERLRRAARARGRDGIAAAAAKGRSGEDVIDALRHALGPLYSEPHGREGPRLASTVARIVCSLALTDADPSDGLERELQELVEDFGEPTGEAAENIVTQSRIMISAVRNADDTQPHHVTVADLAGWLAELVSPEELDTFALRFVEGLGLAAAGATRSPS